MHKTTMASRDLMHIHTLKKNNSPLKLIAPHTDYPAAKQHNPTHQFADEQASLLEDFYILTPSKNPILTKVWERTIRSGCISRPEVEIKI